MDITTLGIEVRSESLLRASQDLDKFASTTTAEQAADVLQLS